MIHMPGVTVGVRGLDHTLLVVLQLHHVNGHGDGTLGGQVLGNSLLAVRQHDEVLDPGHLSVLLGLAFVGSAVPPEWVVRFASQAAVVENGHERVPDEATLAAIPTAVTVE